MIVKSVRSGTAVLLLAVLAGSYETAAAFPRSVAPSPEHPGSGMTDRISQPSSPVLPFLTSSGLDTGLTAREGRASRADRLDGIDRQTRDLPGTRPAALRTARTVHAAEDRRVGLVPDLARVCAGRIRIFPTPPPFPSV